MRIEARNDAPKWIADFCEVPSRLRQGPASIGLAAPQLWGQFLKMAPPQGSEFWLAYEGDTAVGRVGVSLAPHYPGTGVVGFFETDVRHAEHEAIATMLLSTAVEWLKTKGCTSFVGPMNLNTWFQYRFRVDEDDRAYPWEPQNPKEYPHYFEKAGFAPLEKYHSVGSAGLAEFAAHAAGGYQKALSLGYTFRGWDGANVLEKEVPILHTISNEGFAQNFLFQPLPLELFRQLYVPLANKFDFSYSFFCLNPQGKEVGFCFSFLDGDALVLKSATVLASDQGKGLSNALMHLSATEALKRGITKYTSALMREGNRSESYSKRGTTLWSHHYTLYKKG